MLKFVTLNFWMLAVCTLNSAHHSLDGCVSSSDKDCINVISPSTPLEKIGSNTYSHLSTSFAIPGSISHWHSFVLSFDDTWHHLHFMIEVHASPTCKPPIYLKNASELKWTISDVSFSFMAVMNQKVEILKCSQKKLYRSWSRWW